jgi:hypothetical protein
MGPFILSAQVSDPTVHPCTSLYNPADLLKSIGRMARFFKDC